jgi:hypothetical protein
MLALSTDLALLIPPLTPLLVLLLLVADEPNIIRFDGGLIGLENAAEDDVTDMDSDDT